MRKPDSTIYNKHLRTCDYIHNYVYTIATWMVNSTSIFQTSYRSICTRSPIALSLSNSIFFTVRFNVTSLIHHEYFLTLGSTSNTLLLLLAIDHQYISDNYDPIHNISLTIATVFLPFQKALIIPSSFNQSQTFFISDHLSIYIN